ncbi:MAG: hypothetical protein ACE5R6_15865 [Candidatus Heimdallarchaeota archaeon]
MSKEPYSMGLIKGNPFCGKKEILGDIVAILDLIIEKRGMQLIAPMSRAILKHTICELALTDEETAGPGHFVNHVGYLGLFEVKTGGVAVVGDTIRIRKKLIGRLVGFDTTHAPNHLNLIVKSEEVITGAQMKLQIGDPVTITMTSEI